MVDAAICLKPSQPENKIVEMKIFMVPLKMILTNDIAEKIAWMKLDAKQKSCDFFQLIISKSLVFRTTSDPLILAKMELAPFLNITYGYLSFEPSLITLRWL